MKNKKCSGFFQIYEQEVRCNCCNFDMARNKAYDLSSNKFKL